MSRLDLDYGSSCIIGRPGTGKTCEIKKRISNIYHIVKNSRIFILSDECNEYNTKYGQNFSIDALSFNLFSFEKQTFEAISDKIYLMQLYTNRLEDFFKLLMDDSNTSKRWAYNVAQFCVSKLNYEDFKSTTIFDIADILKNSCIDSFVELGQLILRRMHGYKIFHHCTLKKSKITSLFIGAREKNRNLTIYTALCKMQEELLSNNFVENKTYLIVDTYINDPIILGKLCEISRLIRKFGGSLIWTCYDYIKNDDFLVLMSNTENYQFFNIDYKMEKEFNDLLDIRLKDMNRLGPGCSYLYKNKRMYYQENKKEDYFFDF